MSEALREYRPIGVAPRVGWRVLLWATLLCGCPERPAASLPTDGAVPRVPAVAPLVAAAATRTWLLKLRTSAGKPAVAGRAELSAGAGAPPCDSAVPIERPLGKPVPFAADGVLAITVARKHDDIYARLLADNGEVGFVRLTGDVPGREVTLAPTLALDVDLKCGQGGCRSSRLRAAAISGATQRCEVPWTDGPGTHRLPRVPRGHTLYVYGHGDPGEKTESNGNTTFLLETGGTLTVDLQRIAGERALDGRLVPAAGAPLAGLGTGLKVKVSCPDDLFREATPDLKTGRFRMTNLPPAECTCTVHVVDGVGLAQQLTLDVGDSEVADELPIDLARTAPVVVRLSGK